MEKTNETMMKTSPKNGNFGLKSLKFVNEKCPQIDTFHFHFQPQF